MKNLTKYQKTHYPVRVSENKCFGEVVNGYCDKCGRDIKTTKGHAPNITGSLGYTEYYADGTTVVKPGKN